MRNHFKEVLIIMIVAFSLSIMTATAIMLIFKYLQL